MKEWRVRKLRGQRLRVESCVCVCERMVCVCVTSCVRKSCVRQSCVCVCERVARDQHVCERVVCDKAVV